jgi:hypothetical protein
MLFRWLGVLRRFFFRQMVIDLFELLEHFLLLVEDLLLLVVVLCYVLVNFTKLLNDLFLISCWRFGLIKMPE